MRTSHHVVRAAVPADQEEIMSPLRSSFLNRAAIGAIGAVLAIGCTAQTDNGSQSADGAATVPLYDNLGSMHYPVTTRSADAQRYFDQGLRLTYAFNHAEAIRAYREASRLDPSCAMCYWGEAYAYGPNINMPMDSASEAAAQAAIAKAQEQRANATDREQALIAALATRYDTSTTASRAHLDSAYALAMRQVADSYPDDVNVQTLYADALMNLSPWSYWDGERPRPATTDILTRLEGAIARDSNHPGACHLYIHAVEAAHPDRAIPCAERLAALMPGAGHLVHMPAHIYIRTGRWAEAITANEHAIHTDETYIADARPESLYPMLYYPHNIHFLSFAAMMSGRGEMALRNARLLPGKIPAEVAADVAELQLILAHPYLTSVTFARWGELLAAELPDPSLHLTTALVHYARGTAFAATNDERQARASLDSLRAHRAAISDPIGTAVSAIAEHALQGEIEARGGRPQAAIPHFREAARLEDGLQYMEPPFWYYPIRHSLGAVLLEAGRAGEAETAYREDLKRFPENGWSLYGLAESLKRQNKTAEAAEVEGRFRQQWSGADVQLTASRI
jgi:tetratricopeptide (TPR) repeat protein